MANAALGKKGAAGPAVTPPRRIDAAVMRDEMHRAVILIALSTFVLLLIGVVMVYSATAPTGLRNAVVNDTSNPFEVANTQLFYSLVGVFLAIIAALLPSRFYRRFAVGLFALGIGLQLLVITPLGVVRNGNRNWVSFGGILQIQPSEFLKIATIVFLAAALARLRPETATWKDYVIPAGLGTAIGVISIMVGRDMGTALMYVMIALGMFWLTGLPGRYLLSIAGFGVLLAAVAVAADPSRLERVTYYFGTLFSLPDSVSPTQQDYALWAFGSGGIGGSGLGTGAEKWPGNLAEAQTDFIFAVIGEELGLGGCLVVIALFIVLGWSLTRICRFHPDKFARFTAGGVAVWLTGQALMNMLVVTGVLPVFGVPLPFISQGGSAVLAGLLGIGVAESMALSAPGVRESFRVRHHLAFRARALVRRGTHE